MTEQIALLSAMPISVDSPDKMLLLKHGANINATGGNSKYRMSDAAAVIKRSLTKKTKSVVDYDHQIDINILGRKGGNAPAAGWLASLSQDGEGLWAHVDWTKSGAAAIADKEYLYISPVVAYGKDGEVKEILRASLTNIPQLELTEVEVKAILSQQNNEDDKKMDDDEFKMELLSQSGFDKGLDATEALAKMKLLAAEAAIVKEIELTLSQVKVALGLKSGSSNDDIIKACSSRLEKDAGIKKDGDDQKNDGEASDLKGDGKDDLIKELMSRINVIEDGAKNDNAEAVVGAAIKSGRLIPTLRDWGIGLCQRDPESFAEWVGKTSVISGDGKSILPDHIEGEAILSQSEKNVCAQMGIEEKDYLKTKQEKVAK